MLLDGRWNESSSTLAAQARLRGLRVLIVEDSWHMAIAVQSLLEGLGMVIAGAAATTIDAERLASVNAPRVAVVDVKLQDGMAFDLIDRLHDLGIRIVVISGFSTFSTPLEKAVAILPKPFEKGELLDALVHACC
jgi:ActR/RegA family two-component response regulator